MVAPKIFQQLGDFGYKRYAPYLDEEFLRELKGKNGRRKYREMANNDPTIGAVLFAVSSMLRRLEWKIVRGEGDTNGEQVDFLKSCMDDMEISWEDFISEVVTMFPFGFSLFEKVYKKRDGIKSKFKDNKIGLKLFAPRAQETIIKWDLTNNGYVRGLYQEHPSTGVETYIPRDKVVLFRTTSQKNNPEGISILRNCYTSYYYLTKLQSVEAIAAERELTGIPIVRAPSKDLEDPIERAKYIKISRDLYYNSQSGLVLSSDLIVGEDGKLSDKYEVDIQLISADGKRLIDIGDIIARYQQDMARAVNADFLMLGTNDRGSFALSKSKTSLFLNSLECYAKVIASTLNREWIQELFTLNGVPQDKIPTLVAGDIVPRDPQDLLYAIQALVQANILDPETIDDLRSKLDLPALSETTPVEVQPTVPEKPAQQDVQPAE